MACCGIVIDEKLVGQKGHRVRLNEEGWKVGSAQRHEMGEIMEFALCSSDRKHVSF